MEDRDRAIPVRLAAFSPRGDLVALGLCDGSVKLIDAEHGTVTWSAKLHQEMIWTVQFDDSGERLLTTGDDGYVNIVDARTGQPSTRPLNLSAAVRSAAWLPGSRGIVVGVGDGRVVRIDATSGRSVWTYNGHRGRSAQSTPPVHVQFLFESRGSIAVEVELSRPPPR